MIVPTYSSRSHCPYKFVSFAFAHFFVTFALALELLFCRVRVVQESSVLVMSVLMFEATGLNRFALEPTPGHSTW